MPVQYDHYIKLTEEDLFKIDIIKSAIEEEVSTNKIVSGMLDQGFCTALWVMKREGSITPDALEYALEQVPEDLIDDLMTKISNPPKRQEWESSHSPI